MPGSDTLILVVNSGAWVSFIDATSGDVQAVAEGGQFDPARSFASPEEAAHAAATAT
ncbi:hypothetical protein AB0883_18145 [Micromonospora sp. NPDC047812]|uniref:hypothetical protein n=1 Tax=Micromonospora sp. NPDC047812 TaxID=3155742 RepID=UPI0034531EDD